MKKRTLFIFTIIASFVMIGLSACNSRQNISGEAPQFQFTDQDQVVSTVLDTATRYAATVDSNCQVKNGRRLKNPALLGVNNDTSTVTESIAIPGDTMNQKGWFYKDQLNTGSSSDRDRNVITPVTGGGSSSGIPDWIKFLFWVVVGLLLVALAIWVIRRLLADNLSSSRTSRHSETEGRDDNPMVIHHHGDIYHFHGDIHHHHEVVREEPPVQQNQVSGLERLMGIVNELKNREGSISHTDANGANTEIELGTRLPKEEGEKPDDEAK
ncbi:hypothetical protein H6790_02750 [Candidatus Nomurabacteria bacterium]|nr:hypothetical protein [Candidatus Nomurabacteria bacterium]